MSRNDARKFLAQGTASALTLALGLTFAAQPAFAETAKAADPAAPVPAPAPSDGPSPEAPAPAPSEKPAAVVFKDVPQTHMFYQEITWLGETGISTGWSDGTFRPHDSVTREALAAFFYRAANMNDDVAPTQAPFTDVTSKSPFYREIAWFKAQKITTGWPDGTFRPHEPVTREATAAFVFRFAKI